MADADAGLVIRCGTLFDGASVSNGQTLVVRNGRFVSDEPAPNCPVLDLSNHFVMPGLVDAHAHLSTTSLFLDSWPAEPVAVEQALSIPGNLRVNLNAGTTTMRVLGEQHWLDEYARAAVRSGQLTGPTLVLATRPITAALCTAINPFDDSVGMRSLVAENFDHGADFIKIVVTEGAEGGREPLLSAMAMAVAVEEAQRRSSYVSAHGHGGPAILDAILTGVRSIEHGFDLTRADLATMRTHGTWLVSTLAFDFHESGLEKVIDKIGPEYLLRDLIRAREDIAAVMRTAIEVGVPLAFGSNHLPGSMAEEIRLAVGFGMPIDQALAAATVGGASLLGMADRIGTVEPGKTADLIALRSDPFADLGALDDVVLVMKGGDVAKNALHR